MVVHQSTIPSFPSVSSPWLTLVTSHDLSSPALSAYTNLLQLTFNLVPSTEAISCLQTLTGADLKSMLTRRRVTFSLGTRARASLDP